MTTTNVQPTKGPVESGTLESGTILRNGYVFYRLVSPFDIPGNHKEADASLFADALNTHTLTGLTPSELAERVKAQDERVKVLEEALERYGRAMRKPGLPDLLDLINAMHAAEAALTKSAGGGQ